MQAAWLARPDSRREVTAVLGIFVGRYEHWISERLEARLHEIPQEMREAADINLDRCREACPAHARGCEAH